MQVLKGILGSKWFWVIMAVVALFYGLNKMNTKRVEGDEAIKASIPDEVAAQLADPATAEQFRGEPGICPDCTAPTAIAKTPDPAPTATAKTPDPASIATATLASATPQVLVYQPVTVNGKGAGSGKPPTGGGSWTVTNNGGTVINAPVTVN